MAELQFPNIAGAFQQGQQLGTLQRLQGQSEQRRSRLAELAGQAYNANPGEQRNALVGQAVGVDPGAGFQLQQDLGSTEDARTRSLVNAAKMLTSAPAAQRASLYQQMKPGLAQFGLRLPDQYDDETVGKTALALVQAYGPKPDQELAPRVVGNALVDSTGKELYVAKPEQDYQWSDRAGAWIPKPMGGGQQQYPQTGDTSVLGEDGSQIPMRTVRGADGQEYRVQVGDQNAAQAGAADMGADGQAANVRLPQRDVAPQQRGRLSAIPVAGIGPKTEDQYQTLSAQEVVGLGLPTGTIAQRSPTGQVQIINKPRDLPTGGQTIDNGDGTTTYIPAGKITEGERNASGFYQRMISANEEMDRLTNAGYDASNRRDFYTAGGEFLNPLASNEGQQYRQAQENWVRANLRKESGAAIGAAEMDQERKNYFPIPGDGKDVIAQKARNRQVTERAMRQAAGGGLAPPQQSAAQTPAASGDWSIQRVD